LTSDNQRDDAGGIVPAEDNDAHERALDEAYARYAASITDEERAEWRAEHEELRRRHAARTGATI
jgi:hypothetical protein